MKVQFCKLKKPAECKYKTEIYVSNGEFDDTTKPINVFPFCNNVRVVIKDEKTKHCCHAVEHQLD